MPDRNHLCKKIKAAFAQEPAPGDDLLAPGNKDREKLRIAERFRGVDWRDLDAAFIAGEPDAISYLSPTAYRFFLPGYLIAALEDSATMDVALDSLLSSLAGPVYHQERFEELSPDQLQLVLEVLDVLSPNEDDPYFWDFEHAKRGVRQAREQPASADH